MEKVVIFERAYAKYQRICTAYESAYIEAGGVPSPSLVQLSERRTRGHEYLAANFPVQWSGWRA